MAEEHRKSDEYLKRAREHLLSRCTVNGVDTTDFVEIVGSVERWDDWCKAWSERAAIHEALGRAALAEGHGLSAAEHLCRAAVTYHYGESLFMHDMAQQRAVHAKAVECHTLALPHTDPPGERVMIPYESTELAAVLRKPHGVPRPPVVFMTMGLDSTKEELMTFETTFLARGMATLAVDGPGQGEGQYDMAIRPDYENVARPVIDWIERRGDLDAGRIGIWGISLGGYYSARAAAFEPRIKAVIFNSGQYNCGWTWEKRPALSREAFRVRTQSTSDEQARERAGELSLEGIASRIRCPLLIIAGTEDWVSLDHPKRLAAETGGPVKLMIIEKGKHVSHNRHYLYRPQSADWMAEQLGVHKR
jgi:2,6-dihydroxypseudooxynicotine hydrolase